MSGPAPRPDNPTAVPSRTTVVIIGGGVMGVSTAYHLALLGQSDVVLLEQGTLSCGTTWHAAGLVGQLRTSRAVTGLIAYSADLYARLEAEAGLSTGWRQCGSIQVARTPARLEVLRRTVSRAETSGIAAELISGAEAGRRWPLMSVDDLCGAVWVASDGRADPSGVTAALARAARQRGVRILERIRVEAMDVHDGRVHAVLTDRGVIECDTVVICAGQWSKKVGRMAGVAVPLHSAEHFYAVTERIDGVAPDLPVLRDPDGHIYFKEETGGLVMGGFEPVAKPWLGPFDLPDRFEFELLPEDLDQVRVLIDSAHHRVPAMSTVGIRKIYNGPESFTPDGQPVLGRSSEVDNAFVGAGFNSAGIALAGGSGRALAEWIVSGRPEQDLALLDIRRFGSFEDNEQYLRTRVIETLGLHYAMPWPNRQYASARPLRRSPVYHRHEQLGACMVSEGGWEVPYVYGAPGRPPVLDYGFGRASWFTGCAAEQGAARTGVALFDHTARATFALSGRDSHRIVAGLGADVGPLDLGEARTDLLLVGPDGCAGVVTVLRSHEDGYLLATGPGEATRMRHHLRGRIADAHAVLVDTSGGYAAFSLLGPRAGEVLSRLGPAGGPMPPAAFAGRRELGLVSAWCFPFSLGELAGWQIVVSTDFAVTLFDSLLAAGAKCGIQPTGAAAWDALRIGAGVPVWGRELSPDVSPAELHDPVPVPGRRLVRLQLRTPDVVLWGGEPIRRDGRLVGHLTSGALVAEIGTGVGLGFITAPDDPAADSHPDSASYDIEVGGTRYPAMIRESRDHAEVR
jgi:4-methylaminobutanoate oxidase (formaldehyde-forming)